MGHCSSMYVWFASACASAELERLSRRRCGEWAEGSRQVDDDGDRFSDLRKRQRSGVAERANHPCRRDGTEVLALGR
jgi:hypothetical protein